MICLTISNSSELLASKIGQFIENLTPDDIDQTIVEKKVLDQIVENLSKEGLQGRISLVKGIDINEGKKIILNNKFSIVEEKSF